MARKNDSKRQMKLAKKKAARKQKTKTLVRMQQERLQGRSPIAQARRAAEWPLHRCYVNGAWRGMKMRGLAHVTVTRRSAGGSIALAAFLVDVACLGVKNALFKSGLDEADLAGHLDRYHPDDSAKPCAPATAARIVAEGVAYARELGFEPHPDYGVARLLLAGIDPAESEEQVYCGGANGKPLYISGPRDDASRIIRQLTTRLGSDGFDYVTPLHELME